MSSTNLPLGLTHQPTWPLDMTRPTFGLITRPARYTWTRTSAVMAGKRALEAPQQCMLGARPGPPPQSPLPPPHITMEMALHCGLRITALEGSWHVWGHKHKFQAANAETRVISTNYSKNKRSSKLIITLIWRTHTHNQLIHTRRTTQSLKVNRNLLRLLLTHGWRAPSCNRCTDTSCPRTHQNRSFLSSGLNKLHPAGPGGSGRVSSGVFHGSPALRWIMLPRIDTGVWGKPGRASWRFGSGRAPCSLTPSSPQPEATQPVPGTCSDRAPLPSEPGDEPAAPPSPSSASEPKTRAGFLKAPDGKPVHTRGNFHFFYWCWKPAPLLAQWEDSEGDRGPFICWWAGTDTVNPTTEVLHWEKFQNQHEIQPFTVYMLWIMMITTITN